MKQNVKQYVSLPFCVLKCIFNVTNIRIFLAKFWAVFPVHLTEN